MQRSSSLCPPLVAFAAPFAGGATANFTGLGSTVPAGGRLTYLLVASLTDRLHQGDTLGLRVTVVSGTGGGSQRRALASIPTPVSSHLGPATPPQSRETVLVSEKPVLSG